jgi:hypothetical protein
MLALKLTELLQLQFRGAVSHADVGSIIALPTVLALKPNIFPFAFFSHTTLLCRSLIVH